MWNQVTLSNVVCPCASESVSSVLSVSVSLSYEGSQSRPPSLGTCHCCFPLLLCETAFFLCQALSWGPALWGHGFRGH
jgi:hypothetical protein